MTGEDTFTAFMFIVFVFSAAIGGAIGGRSSMRANMQTEAVQHGAAEWKVNADGSTEFRWLNKAEKE